MIFLYILTTSVIILCFSGVTTAEEDITGFLNATVTLPCAYSSKRQDIEVCWRKAGCSNNTCTSAAILRTNGSSVTMRKSNRYKLLGNITKGDASLTITSLTMKDGGTYCCKVKIPGAYNDVKQEVNLQIMEMPVVIGSMNDTVTLPCTYSPSTGVTLCWVRGSCSNSMCLNAIFRSSSKVTNRTSTRYELLGNMTQGNASLTITSLTAEDDGIYCCKVVIPGKYNDVKKEISLQFLKSDGRLNWVLLGNVIRGIIVLLVPTMVLLIYKCCPLQSY